MQNYFEMKHFHRNSFVKGQRFWLFIQQVKTVLLYRWEKLQQTERRLCNYSLLTLLVFNVIVSSSSMEYVVKKASIIRLHLKRERERERIQRAINIYIHSHAATITITTAK